jgi:hypothetical protein
VPAKSDGRLPRQSPDQPLHNHEQRGFEALPSASKGLLGASPETVAELAGQLRHPHSNEEQTLNASPKATAPKGLPNLKL